MSAPIHRLREEWLRRVGDAMASTIEKAAGAPLPQNWRVSCGFMSQGIRSKAIGQCWSPEASKDGATEIFITPRLDDAAKVAAVLAHEMIHACLPGIGHGKPFVKAAKEIGFAAPVTKFNPTDALWAWLLPIVEAAGPYPHAEIIGAARAAGAPKKQNARMIKAECPSCGYTVRLARKWIETKGAPICPEHFRPMMTEGLIVIREEEGEDRGE
jgi:hypothetical protein